MSTTTAQQQPTLWAHTAVRGGTREDTPRAELDKAIADLVAAKSKWLEVPVVDRVKLLDTLLADSQTVAEEQVAAACKAKGLDPNDPRAGEEWLGGPLCLHRCLRLFRQSLHDVATLGVPRLPGPVTERADGQVIAQVFPDTWFDKVLFSGLTAEIWMEPGVTKANLRDNMAAIYRSGAKREGKLALVLGAGNVASIGPMDVLTKLFVEDQVCILKMNPVNEYLGPFVERAFKALVERGFLRVVYGGAEVGKYLCTHEQVDEIHITGSDKTHDAIVWGPPGPEREERKKNKKPLLEKRITSELGNVSSVIVVPGPWSEGDVDFHALNIASQVQNNGSFNCNAAKVIVQQASWPQRQALLEGVKRWLKGAGSRKAYYPGAEDRYKAFVAAHPEAEVVGSKEPGSVPWTVIPNVSSAKKDDVCFKSEAFCGVIAETSLEASDPIDFLKKAVAFANDDLWGTLNCCILVHPKTLADPAFAAAFEQALADLRFGTIGVNVWPAIGYGLVSTTWGAHPGHPLEDIQSGRGAVHNSFLFDKPMKSVVRAPFRMWPIPPWFFAHRRTHELGRKLADFEAAPSALKLPSIIWTAARP